MDEYVARTGKFFFFEFSTKFQERIIYLRTLPRSQDNVELRITENKIII